MKVTVFGAMSMAGKSKKTNAAYEMRRLYVASELKSGTTDSYVRRAAGFEAAELEVDAACFDDFLGLRYPVQLDLITDMRPMGGKFVPVVVGIAAAAKAAA